MFRKKYPSVSDEQIKQMKMEADLLSEKAKNLIATLNGEDEWFLAVCKKEAPPPLVKGNLCDG